jgi:RimJ/RimL family protein N-acetyltransferase
VPPTRLLGFRPLAHSDAAFAAEVEAETDPLHVQSAAEILDRWENTEMDATVRRFAVQVDGVDFGWISLIKPFQSAGDAVWLNLIVPGEDESVFDAALAYVETQAVELNAALLVSPIWEKQAAAVELEPNAARLAELRAAARARIEEHGIGIATAAELGGEAVYPALHRVNAAAEKDIPTTVPHTPESFETWLRWMQSPWIFTDRIWVATADGEPVGYSYLAYRPSLAETGFTGVVREHRNKGIARALKLETLVQAIGLGVQAVETDNDYENAPILHLNEELGYQELASRLEFHKPVVPA